MNNLRKTLFHILLKSLLLANCFTIASYEITVASSNITVCATDCDFTTLQAAINAPNTLAGTIITIREPVHTEAGIVINKDITIQGPEGGEPIVIQAHADPKSSKNRVFRIEEGINVTLRHLIIQHGRAPRSYPPSGGAILNFGMLLLEACIIRNNNAMDGGGILNKGTLTIKNSTLSDNMAHGVHPDPGLSCGTGGAIKCEKGELTLSSSTISGNETAEDGGGLFIACKCRATIKNTTIRENKAHEHGGGIRLRGTLTLDHSTIDHNSALIGGGIHVHGTLEFSNTIIANNTRKDCHLVIQHPYKGVGTIVSNTRNLIADQSCESEYFGDPELGPQDIGTK